MLELLLILLGLNFTNTSTPALNIDADHQTVGTSLPQNADPGDTGGENQPIPPRK